MKYALNSVPGLADIRVLHGDVDGPQSVNLMSGGVRKKVWNALIYNAQQYLFAKVCSKISPWSCWCWGTPWGWGWIPRLNPDVWGVRKKIQMTNIILLNNTSSMLYALKSVPSLADVGVLQGNGDGPRAPPRCPGGPEKIKWLISLCPTICLPWNML